MVTQIIITTNSRYALVSRLSGLSQTVLACRRIVVDLLEDTVLHYATHEVDESFVLICFGKRLDNLQSTRVEPQHVHRTANLLLRLHLLDAPHNAAIEWLHEVSDPANNAEERKIPGA